MTRRSRWPHAVGAAIALAGVCALAQDSKVNRTICERGDRQQFIDVVFETGKTLPCELRVTRSKLSKPRSMWRANNEEGFCEVKAIGMVQRLTDAGWDCRVAETEPTRSEAEKNVGETGTEPNPTKRSQSATPPPPERAAEAEENSG